MTETDHDTLVHKPPLLLPRARSPVALTPARTTLTVTTRTG